MNPYADHMKALAELYGKDAPEKWRRIMRGMLGDPDCRVDYVEWEEAERRTNGGSDKGKNSTARR